MKKLIMTLGVLVSLIGLGQAGWISAKAWLAQEMIESAWLEQLASGKNTPPWPWADTYPVARLRVKRLKIDQMVMAGMSGRSIAFGPGLAMAGSLPGGPGTILISGHRDTHLAFLADIKPGDIIELQGDHGDWHRFTVAGFDIVDGSTQIELDPGESSLVLATCYPFDGITGNASQRIVVTAHPLWT